MTIENMLSKGIMIKKMIRRAAFIATNTTRIQRKPIDSTKYFRNNNFFESHMQPSSIQESACAVDSMTGRLITQIFR